VSQKHWEDPRYVVLLINAFINGAMAQSHIHAKMADARHVTLVTKVRALLRRFGRLKSPPWQRKSKLPGVATLAKQLKRANRSSAIAVGLGVSGSADAVLALCQHGVGIIDLTHSYAAIFSGYFPPDGTVLNSVALAAAATSKMVSEAFVTAAVFKYRLLDASRGEPVNADTADAFRAAMLADEVGAGYDLVRGSLPSAPT